MGGRAIQGDVVAVSSDDVPEIVSRFINSAGIHEHATSLVGSTGKVPFSSDIDLVVDMSTHNPGSIHDNLSRQGIVGVINNGTRISSYRFPKQKSLTGEYVQVDLIFTPSISWAKFAYFADPTSKYKGAIRTLLLMGVATMMHNKSVDCNIHKDGTEVVRVRRTFDLNDGLRRMVQVKNKRKDGSGYLKNFTTSTIEKVSVEYPQVLSLDDWEPVTDPQTALKMMFGCDVDTESVRTAEGVISLIKTHFSHDEQQQIFERTQMRARTLPQNITIPKELS